jgi:hypothetical protein
MDVRKLAEEFEKSRARNATDASARQPRAPGREVVATRVCDSPATSNSAVSTVAARAKGGKTKRTCARCKSLVSARVPYIAHLSRRLMMMGFLFAVRDS